MFVLIARYKIKKSYQRKFVEESKKFYSVLFKKAKGFVGINFLRNILDTEFIDVVTEWKTKEAFLEFVSTLQKGETPEFSVAQNYKKL